MIVIVLLLANSIKEAASCNFQLIDEYGYNHYAPVGGDSLLLVDGGTSTVHYDYITTESKNWICRMLGYQSYKSQNTYDFPWMFNFPVRYIHIKCLGSVVPQCSYMESCYTSDKALWINCNARTQYGDTTNFYLVDRNRQHTQKEYGLLMYNGGTVSGNKFNDETAKLVCYIMGYKGVMSWKLGNTYFGGQESLDITITNLHCLTNDRAFPLCTYGTDAANSTHNEDVWLWCYRRFRSYLVCPPGQRISSAQVCYECAANTYSPDPSTGYSCLSCPANSTSLAGSTFCSCKEGTYMNSAGDQCLTCPEKSTSKKGSTFCTCMAGTYLYTSGGEISCVQCPGGKISKEGSTAPANCVDCPFGTAPLNDGQACSCDQGYGWEWSNEGEEEIGYCEPCLANFYKSKTNGTCAACPKVATSLPLSEECQCPSGMSWDGNNCMDCQSTNSTLGGVCDCLAGTFWSEESGKCEPCPLNHFSGKFSSVCKMCPLLTVSEPQSAECTSCSTGNFWENYTCTECPDNHVGNGATCSVCPKGTSPSKDKTICQKSDTSIDPLSIGSMTLVVLITIAVVGNIFFTLRERRARIVLENLQLTYQAESSTSKAGVKVKGRRCMFPSCPCSEVPKPALPKRGATVQQDDFYANFSN